MNATAIATAIRALKKGTNNMTHLTEDELEAMAAQTETVERDLNNGFPMTSERGVKLQQAAAMLRACKGRFRVKALEWDELGDRWGTVTSGRIQITQRGCVPNWDLSGASPEVDGYFDTLEAAKAAAQADYEARILAALEPAPDHDTWNAAIEAAADKAYLQADIDARPQAISEAIRALKKGPRHD